MAHKGHQHSYRALELRQSRSKAAQQIQHRELVDSLEAYASREACMARLHSCGFTLTSKEVLGRHRGYMAFRTTKGIVAVCRRAGVWDIKHMPEPAAATSPQ